MRKYIKPVLEVSEDMTEGVYLASGNAQDEEKTTCRLRNHKECVFFAEAKCRLLQNAMYVGCCKADIGGYTPKPL